MKRKLFACFLALVLCLTGLPLAASAAGTGNDAARLLAKTQDSVASLWVVGYDASGQPVGISTGTCFAVGTEGKDTDVFLTNRHVVTLGGKFPVENARVWIIKENCAFYDNGQPDPNNSIECRVVKTTSGYPDYAILKMQKWESGYKALPLLSARKVEKGTRVYALGFPGIVDQASTEQFGGANLTATDGIISRHSQLSFAGNTSALLHTATISQGNSGGPLITKDGAVVGINTYGIGETSIDYSCAIYIDYAMEGLNEMGISYTVYSRVWLYAAIAAAVIVVLAVAIWIILAQKNKKAEEERKRLEAERQKKEEDERKRQRDSAQVSMLYQKIKVLEQSGKFQLLAENGGTYPISATGTTIGRDSSCQICLPGNTKGVSHQHCRLTVQANRLILTDVGSTYGTFIHGTKIPVNTPIELHSGSSFCLGGPNSNRFTVQ